MFSGQDPVDVSLSDLSPFTYGSTSQLEKLVVNAHMVVCRVPSHTFQGKVLEDQHLTINMGTIGGTKRRELPCMRRALCAAVRRGEQSVDFGKDDHVSITSVSRSVVDATLLGWSCDVF